VQAKKRVARRRHHRRETRETFHGRHDALLDASAPGVLHAVDDEAVAAHAEARQRERRSRKVAAQPLAAPIVVGVEMDASVQVEALVHRRVHDARRWLGKLGLCELAGVPRRLERATLHACEGQRFAHAVRRRLVRAVRLAEQSAVEVLPKLLFDVLRKRAVVRLARVPKEVLEVLLHETEEHGFLRLLSILNSLWSERGYAFLDAYLDLLAQNYEAGLSLLDFASDPEGSRSSINRWVSDRTKTRIPELLRQGVITSATVLVLTNAIYFKASWKEPFVAVDEKGTEAAAATAVVVGRTSAPERATFKADRPFVIVIRDNPTGAVLFLGQVTSP